jgi:hypothetical protein
VPATQSAQFPPVAAREVVVTVDRIEIAELDDAFPDSRTDYGGDNIRSVSRRITAGPMSILNLDFAALNAFELDLPDGTIMADHGGSGVRYEYEWRGGQIVRQADGVPLRSLDYAAANSFAPPDTNRWWLDASGGMLTSGDRIVVT